MILDAGFDENKDKWKKAGFEVYDFDRKLVKENTAANPFWIHFGAGNIFRAFQANAVQKLLNEGILDRGLIVCEGYDYEIITKMNEPCDNLSILATLKSDGSVEKTVVASVTESYALDCENAVSFKRLKEIFSKKSLEMASFTITEKGYSLTNAVGEVFEDIKSDYENGPGKPKSYLGKVAALLYERFVNGAYPLAMVSMDNCSHNGDKLYEAINSFAQKWEDGGLCKAGFKQYAGSRKSVSYPWTMIDKITPRPDEEVKQMLMQAGAEKLDAIVTSKNTYIAPFVNSEECEYLVIEDDFPNGRQPLEKAGFIFTDRETVDMVEKMKVCTCLNPLHTSLAVFGCLLGYIKISEEMKDKDLQKIVELVGYKEGLRVVTNPGIINPKDFIDAVVKIRIPNPFMPDTPQRIATDTSQKLPIRFGETIKRYMKDETLDSSKLEAIPLVLAGWLRYLLGINDEGRAFERSSDPRLSELSDRMKKIDFADNTNAEEVLKGICEDETIFGVNLDDAGLTDKVIKYFCKMNEGVGAVRRTLSEIE